MQGFNEWVQQKHPEYELDEAAIENLLSFAFNAAWQVLGQNDPNLDLIAQYMAKYLGYYGGMAADKALKLAQKFIQAKQMKTTPMLVQP